MLRASTLRRVWLGGGASTPALGTDTRNPQGQFINVIAEGTQARRQPRRTAAHFLPTATRAATEPIMAQSPELRQTLGVIPTMKKSMSKWSRRLRPDIYDELLKLPLRYALHDYEVLQKHMHLLPPQQVVATDSAEEEEGIYRFQKPPETGTEGEDTLTHAHEFYAVSGRHSAVGYAPPLGPADPLDTIPFFIHRTSNGLLPGKIHSMHPRNLMPAFFMRIQGVEGDLFRMEEELMKIFPTKKIFVRSHSLYIYNVGLDGKMVLHHWMLGLGF